MMGRIHARTVIFPNSSFITLSGMARKNWLFWRSLLNLKHSWIIIIDVSIIRLFCRETGKLGNRSITDAPIRNIHKADNKHFCCVCNMLTASGRHRLAWIFFAILFVQNSVWRGRPAQADSATLPHAQSDLTRFVYPPSSRQKKYFRFAEFEKSFRSKGSTWHGKRTQKTGKKYLK